MARLNEAPLPVESVDALKRRFVRQNRELAKNNSAQCLRIRALECEVSRLLAENLDLREEIVHLQAQVTEPRAHLDTSALTLVRDQLQAKLLEVGALVSELDHIQPARPTAQSNKFTDPSTWRPEVPAAILSGQAPRMYGIVEEAKSPGGSLKFDRVASLRLSDQSNGSPDLGPPPVVHFENEDPIKFDPLFSETDHPEQPTSDNESPPATLSVNLETRRKRKDGGTKVQLRRSSLLPPDLDEDEQPQLTRTGAKRKLSVREADDENVTATTKDDFKFSRRSSIAADFKNVEPTITSEPALETSDIPELIPERKVLGNKSVNVSPRKNSRSVKEKNGTKNEDAPLKPAVKAADRRKSRIPSTKSVTIDPEPETIARTIEIALPTELPLETIAPKTPLPEFFSPTPSEPSAARDEGRDTPPPSGLRSMSSGSAALNGASRPSRRARAAVNYAEPNLVSKMRRPTAELGNAVDANGRRISGTSASVKKNMRTVIIKGDDLSRSLTRETGSEAASPLGQKASRDHERTMEPTKHISVSERAISALMASSRANKTENKDDLGVYDLNDSSDVDESQSSSSKKGSRRHSSIAGNSEHEKTKQEMKQDNDGKGEADQGEEKAATQAPLQERKAPRSARVERSGTRRRSMMV